MALFFRPRRPLMRLAARAQQERTGASHGADGVPRAAPAATDSTDGLERLANLHASGALTDVEFAAAKARLLEL